MVAGFGLPCRGGEAGGKIRIAGVSRNGLQQILGHYHCCEVMCAVGCSSGGHDCENHQEHSDTDWDDCGQFQVSAEGDTDGIGPGLMKPDGAFSCLSSFSLHKFCDGIFD